MKIKYNSIADLPIAKYLELQKILKEAKSESFDDTDLNVQMLSIFTDIPEEDIYNSSLFDIGIAMSDLRNALEQPMPPQPNKTPKTLKLCGITYEVTDGVGNFTVAQYIDFQQFIVNDEMIAELLSTFILPKGSKYNDGTYDIDKQIADFKKFLTIGTAVSLRFFFSEKVIELNNRYTQILGGADDEEADKEGDNTDNEGEQAQNERGSKSNSSASSAYTWFALIDLCSDTCRQPWNEIYEMNIVEFLNIIAYRMQKSAKERELYKMKYSTL